MTRSIVLIVLLAGCGANSDPCTGGSGVCIGLRIVGGVSGLDQLAFTIDQPGTMVQRSPDPPKRFNLPVRVALFPPAGTTGTVHVSCDGSGAGQLLAHGEVDATLVNGHAQATLTLVATTSSDLAAPDLAGADGAGVDGNNSNPDLSECATVVACHDGDGCCPGGCNNANDKDCVPVCGNGVVETGEVCDDGNSTNGDGCDPTCLWAGVMTTVSGKPGGCARADGTHARFSNYMGGVTTDGNKIWVSDNTTIREITPGSPPTVTTLFGLPNQNSNFADGSFTDARVFGGFVPLIYLPNKLYFANAMSSGLPVTTVLREVDLVNHTVTSISASVVQNNPLDLTTDGTTIFYLGQAGDVDKWKPGDSVSTQIASASAVSAVLGPSHGSCAGISRAQGATFVRCDGGVLQVTDAGVVSSYAGNAASPAPGCTDNATRTSAGMGGTWVGGLQVDDVGNLFVTDCASVREITSGVSTVAGELNTIGYADGSPGSSLFAAQNSLVFASNTGSSPFFPFGTGFVVVDLQNCAIRGYDPVTPKVFTIAGTPPALHAVDVRGSNSLYSPTFEDLNTGVVSDGTSLFSLGHPAGSSSASPSPMAVIQIDLTSGVSTDLHKYSVGATDITRIGATLYVALTDGTIHSLGTDGQNDMILAGMGNNATYPPSDGTAGNLRSAVLNPRSIGTDGTDLYFIDSAKLLRKITLSTSTVSLVAGTQDTNDVVDGSGGSAHFRAPSGLAYAAGKLYLLDGGEGNQGLIRKVDLATRQIQTIAGHTGSGDSDGVGLLAQIGGARRLTTDGTSLFISDATAETLTNVGVISPTIRQLDLRTLGLTTMIGQRGQWTIQNGTGTNALVSYPGAITFDASTHALYFFDLTEGVYQKVR